MGNHTNDVAVDDKINLGQDKGNGLEGNRESNIRSDEREVNSRLTGPTESLPAPEEQKSGHPIINKPQQHETESTLNGDIADDNDEKTRPQDLDDKLDEVRDQNEEPETGHNLTVPKTAQDHSEKTTELGDEGYINEKQDLAPVGGETSPRNVHGIKWVMVISSILSSTFLFALDNTIVADVQPQIVLTFNDVTKINWLSVSFLLGAASTVLVWGKLYSQFNVKWTYIISVFFFEVGSAICGSANLIDVLIFARALCGVSGAGMYIGVLALVAATTTLHERPTYVGLAGMVWGIGTVLGPVIGGAFTVSSATWRWAFYINLCIGAVAAPVYIFLLPSIDPRPGVAVRDRLREMDYIGIILTIGASCAGVMAISFGGTQYAWNSGQIIALFVVSAVLFIILGFQQYHTFLTTLERRIIPLQFFKSRTLILVGALTGAAASSTFVPIYFIPTFFQFTRADDALEAAVRLLPLIFLLIFATVFNGIMLSKLGYYMPWYLGAGLLQVIAGALFYTVTQDTSVAKVYGYSILLGIGCGSSTQMGFSVSQASVPLDMVPDALGFMSFAQISGLTVSLAIANSIFLNKAQSGLVALLPDTPLDVIRAAISGVGSSFVQNLPPDVKRQVLDALVSAIGKDYILVMTGGAFIAILSLFLKRERLFMK